MAEAQKTVGNKSIVLTEQECKVITKLREIEFGELKIVVQDKIPVRIEEIKSSKI